MSHLRVVADNTQDTDERETAADAPVAADLPLNQILQGDCVDLMNSLPESSVDLILRIHLIIYSSA